MVPQLTTMRQGNLIGIIVGSLLVLGGVSAAIWYFAGPGNWNYYKAYGTMILVEDYPIGIENPNVYVNFEESVSSLDIISDTMSDERLLEVENTVKGPDEYEEDYPSQANYWNISDDGSGTFFLDYIIVNPDEDYHFVHEITIMVDYRANLILNLTSTTGSIEITTRQPNTQLNITNLSVTTGSVDLDFEVDTVLIGDLNIFATTGSVYADFDQSTTLDLDSFSIQTTTGSIDLRFTNLIFTNNLNFSLGVTTGSLDFDWTQQTAVVTDHKFDFVGSTGSVEIRLDFESNIGTDFLTETTTGSNVYPPDTTSQGGRGQISFDIAITTGSISIIRAN